MDNDTKPPPANPLALIDKALSSGISPDQLGKLLDLQERWERSRAIEAFNAALNEAQQEMPAVVKDAENKHTHSMYARLETVTTAIKPVYTRHGFALTFAEEDSLKENHCRIRCNLRHIGGHDESYTFDMPIDGQGAKGGQSSMNPTQAKGSTFSYARRYAVCMIFNLTIAGEDTDAQGPYLSGDQVQEINELIEACEGAGDPVDFKAFLKWLDVPNLADLPDRDHAKTVRYLEAKLAKAKKAKVPA